ncbi:MAG: hypothetical protein QOH01_3126 [Verrucomicrobiota bacterium]|jgi:ABC-type nitrate/sulfonate/bicarbonate transport system substrate-binding protein
MKTKTIILSLAAISVALFAALLISRRGAGPVSAGSPPDVNAHKQRIALTLAFRPGVAVDLGLLQAIERGDLAKQGFDITLRPYGRADLIFAAFKSGEIQGSLGIPLEPLLDQATHGAYPCRGFLVWYFDDKTPYDGMIARADGGVTTIDALQGKAVGSHPSKQVTFFVSRLFPDCSVRPYNPAAPLASLDSGDMSAVYALEPFLSVAQTNPKYRVLETNLISKRIFNNARVPAALSVLSSDWMNSHPTESAAFVRLARAAYLADVNHRDQQLVVKILTEPRFGLAPDVAAKVVEPASSLPEDLDKTQFTQFATALKDGGLLSGDVALEKLLYAPPAK